MFFAEIAYCRSGRLRLFFDIDPESASKRRAAEKTLRWMPTGLATSIPARSRRLPAAQKAVTSTYLLLSFDLQ